MEYRPILKDCEEIWIGLDADDHCPIVIIGEDEAMNVNKLKCS